MLIVDKSYLANIEAEKDKLKFTHVKDVSATIEQAAKMRQHTDGWSKDREFRQIGCIDEIAWQNLIKKHPEVQHDGKKLRDWLFQTEEGQTWKTVDKLSTGRNTRNIIK